MYASALQAPASGDFREQVSRCRQSGRGRHCGRLMQAFKRRVGRLTEPQILFPLAAFLLLTGVWGMTLGIARVRYAAAEQAAEASSAGLLDTYEAQAVRALHDIDQTMNLVKFWHERGSGRRGLAELKDHRLLPSDLLFVVSVSDAAGIIVDSTRPLRRRAD
jgi:two-component system, NtrC family, sensor kinase